MIQLNKRYVIGVHVMWYEIEMFSDYISGLLNVIKMIKNTENIYFDFMLNLSEHLEMVNTELISMNGIKEKFLLQIGRISLVANNIQINILPHSPTLYFHTDYRRDVNYRYCGVVDYIIQGETDSFMPKEGLQAIETLAQFTDEQNIHRYIMSFADRKMWDESWNPTVHVDYEKLAFTDGPDSHLNKNQAKSQLSIEEMNKINSKITDFEFIMIPYTKIDGSFLVISSELIKSGVNVPLCMLYNDDEGIGISYNQLYGKSNNVRQYICKNLLKVHARRHPQKRMYVKDEDNEYSFIDKKGNAFQTFKKLSQENIQALHSGKNKFHTYEDLKKLI